MNWVSIEKIYLYQNHLDIRIHLRIFWIILDIDDCQPHPCQNNGTCHDLVNDYRCVCVAGFNGTYCDNSTYILTMFYLNQSLLWKNYFYYFNHSRFSYYSWGFLHVYIFNIFNKILMTVYHNRVRTMEHVMTLWMTTNVNVLLDLKDLTVKIVRKMFHIVVTFNFYVCVSMLDDHCKYLWC